MNAERHMKQARRVDNGEFVRGYYRVDRNGNHLIYPHDYSLHHNQQDFLTEAFIIDLTTVEDVPVKPIYNGNLYACPNCGMLEIHNSRNKYCPDCGQHIDWSGENER